MSSGNRYGFSTGTLTIPDPKPITTPSIIQEPMIINAPNPIQEPFILPSLSVVSFTFEDSNMIGWTPIDEPPQLLGAEGPSRWGIDDGPISGKALSQTSNIWGDKPDVIALGTFLIYDLQEWYDFTMDFDMYANDNDGIGIIWGWRNRIDHFRFLTMVDPANPAGAPPDLRAPFSTIEKRTGDTSPYYQTLAKIKEASYRDFEITHFRLEVINKVFSIYWNYRLMLQANHWAYWGGKVGFMLYAQSGVFFDNVKIEAIYPMPINQYERFTLPQK
jgi:hypothetical protein